MLTHLKSLRTTFAVISDAIERSSFLAVTKQVSTASVESVLGILHTTLELISHRVFLREINLDINSMSVNVNDSLVFAWSFDDVGITRVRGIDIDDTSLVGRLFRRQDVNEGSGSWGRPSIVVSSGPSSDLLVILCDLLLLAFVLLGDVLVDRLVLLGS